MYTAKIKDARKETSLSDNVVFLDVWFDVLLDGEAVAERRLAFPLGTTEETILENVKKYCVMYENDHKLAAEAGARMEAEAEANKVLDALKGQSV